MTLTLVNPRTVIHTLDEHRFRFVYKPGKDTIVTHAKLVIVGTHDTGEKPMGVLGRDFKLGDDSAGHETIEFPQVPKSPKRELDRPRHHSPSRFFA